MEGRFGTEVRFSIIDSGGREYELIGWIKVVAVFEAWTCPPWVKIPFVLCFSRRSFKRWCVFEVPRIPSPDCLIRSKCVDCGQLDSRQETDIVEKISRFWFSW